MTLKLILTSTVIATIVSGLFAFYQNYRSNKLSKITDERKAWRDDIRMISKNIMTYTNEHKLEKEITKLKVKINAYGNSTFYDEKESEMISGKPNLFQKIKRKSQKRKQDVLQTKYYINDSHIWKQIHLLENNNYDEKDKRKLIDYLSFLLKYDWERAKSEILIDKQMIYSRWIFAISYILVLLLNRFYLKQSGDSFILSAVMYGILYAFFMICSSLPKYDIIPELSCDIHKIRQFGYIPVGIILVAIFIISFFNILNTYLGISNIPDLAVYILPYLLLLTSLLINVESIAKKAIRDNKYRDLLKQYEIDHTKSE